MSVLECDEVLLSHGLSRSEIETISTILNSQESLSPQAQWIHLSQWLLTQSHIPFAAHYYLYQWIYRHHHSGLASIWSPTRARIQQSHLKQLMDEQGFEDYEMLHQWSVRQPEAYWQAVIRRLNIQFHQPPQSICLAPEDPEQPTWLPGAQLNIVQSCLAANKNRPAIIEATPDLILTTYSYGQLADKVTQIAQACAYQKIGVGDPVALILPFNFMAVATYLALIQIGAVAVMIPESFSSEEIKTRLEIVDATWAITQNHLIRGGKTLSLYEKVCKAHAAVKIIVYQEGAAEKSRIRQQDLTGINFLSHRKSVTPAVVSAETPMTLLFSSGTTGKPKAIPWDHTTPIKVAADAHFHQDLHAEDVLAWPTSLGWMMGPWLVFASLLNGATMGLYQDGPQTHEFGQFVEKARVTVLGLVPSLVRAWRESRCMEGLDWHAIKAFSSTGECSNTEDMVYLSALAGYKPIIEYCGGTEIGGAYLTSTVVQPNVPAAFSTPALGIDITLLPESSADSDANRGEVALMGVSMGLSRRLLNADHHEVYFARMPKASNGQPLRRHGDLLKKIGSGYYKALGRADDTMNLGGIKISAAEIERTLASLSFLRESAAVAIAPEGGGPEALIIFAVLRAAAEPPSSEQQSEYERAIGTEIKTRLNPLFKVQKVIWMAQLLRTASGKILHRELKKLAQQAP